VAPSLGAGHDTGELTTACCIQGIPHSPGYPLFVALGWLATKAPIAGEPAYRINLLCALETSLAMAFLGLALSYRVHCIAAVGAASLAGVSVAIWRQAVAAEVFSLHLLFLCSLIYLAVLWQQSTDKSRREIVLVTSAILGCCLAHQHVIALAAPAFLGFGFLAKGKGRIWGFSWLNLPVLLLCLVAPYALQMYFAQQEPALNWEKVTTLPKIVHHFLRKSYGTGLLNQAALQYDSRAGQAQATAYLISLTRNYFPLPSFVLLGLCLDRVVRNGKLNPLVILFGGLSVAYGPFFAILGNQPSTEFYWDMMERFYSSSCVGMAGLIGLGIDWLIQLNPVHRRKLPYALTALIAYTTYLNYPKCSQRGQYYAVDTFRAAYRSFPSRSAAIVGGDLPAGATDYLCYVMGEFRQFRFVYPGLTGAEWHQDRFPIGLGTAARKGASEGAQQGAGEAIFAYLGKRDYALYTNDLHAKVRGYFVRQGLFYRFYSSRDESISQAELVKELTRIFDILESSPKRGPYRMSWKQCYWVRYCLQQWLDAYRDIGEQLAVEKPEIAIRALTRVTEIEEFPTPATYQLRGLAYLKLTRYREASLDLKKALDLGGPNRPLLLALVQVYEALRDNIKAARTRELLQSLEARSR
jgi:hypothetical protein